MRFRPGSCSGFRLISVFRLTRGSGASVETSPFTRATFNRNYGERIIRIIINTHTHTLRMERRLFWLFCVLAALGSVTSQDLVSPKVRIERTNMTLVCDNGVFEPEPMPLTDYAASETFSCCSDYNEEPCSKAVVKILTTDNLIQLDTSAVITVLVSDVLVTVLIGWAVYIVCAQPSTRASYQDSKASDRKNLIPNERAGDGASGDMYQRLNTRSDEYSTLHAQRKPKNPRYPISP